MPKQFFPISILALMLLTAIAASGQIDSRRHRPIPPPICDPCLFYGGDITPVDPNADAFADENTLLFSYTETLGAVTVPYGHQAIIHGVLFNVLATLNDFNPKTATWEIRTGVSSGNGGTQLGYGSGQANITPTGRQAFGYNEYTIAVAVNPPITLDAGTYWFNVTPQCTDSGDENCNTEQFYASNTTHGTNNVQGELQPLHSMYLESPILAFPYENWCQTGLNSYQCAALSFGVIGGGH
ncbi:MAG: hypothetical protein ABSE92_07110 [Terriglobales bacterium]|jgi:hypothetical protein